eukprot:126954_1
MAEDSVADHSELSFFISYVIAAVLMLIIFGVHMTKYWSDFCTEERTSLSHRRNKLEITPKYRMVSRVTLLVVIFYTLNAILYAIEMTDLRSHHCLIIFIFAMWTLIPGKGLMYILFFLRLDQCYSQSAYGYSNKFINIMMGINFFIGILIPSISIYLLLEYGEYTVDNDEFPDPCYPTAEGPVIIAPALMIFWDIVMNVMSICLFVIPLKKVLKTMKTQKNSTKFTDKMIYIAVKYSVLTIVASTTTVVSILFVLSQFFAYLNAFDIVVNSISVVLMTAYYPNDKYYEKLCKCCLYCCPAQYRSNASQGASRAKTNPDSKDTNDVVGQGAISINTTEQSVQLSVTNAKSINISSTNGTQITEPPSIGAMGSDDEAP